MPLIDEGGGIYVFQFLYPPMHTCLRLHPGRGLLDRLTVDF